ncbi:hypothetical protein B9J07_34015 [Sinorhizobium sp. LM21]|nr:hypothetical protein B9J07_34015 [Sinorhizobium sp. LM21]
MSDENKPDDAAVVAEATAPAEVTAPKKRGPRAKKVADVSTSEPSVAPAAKRGRKPKEARAVAVPEVTKKKGMAKNTEKGTASKSSAKEPLSVLDEIADLLQLEEENARLRKALSEKLRAENADLRKRLGIA